DGDDTAHSIPEIVISPLAKGNAYASSVEMSHSSDVKTMEELFHLSFVNNPIPAGETNITGSLAFNNVDLVNDLSDLFKAGSIPAAPNIAVTPGFQFRIPHSSDVLQLVFITNKGTSPVPNPMFLALDNLSAGATLANADGTTSVLAPLGSPY